MLLIGFAYRWGQRALGMLGALAQSARALMTEVLVLRRQVARVRYRPPAGHGSPPSPR